MLIAWPEITSFHNIRKYTEAHPEILNNKSTVKYMPKIKLHGTNAAIQCHKDGVIICQSRESIITPEKDNAGFARWVKSNEHLWQKNVRDVILFGEWIGKNIQKSGVAVSELYSKCFAIFAARPLENGSILGDDLWKDPNVLLDFITDIPHTYVLPWYNNGLTVNWSGTAEDLSQTTDLINEWVSKVEANDPWVDATFGIKGMGEGLVFYPVSDEHQGNINFGNLCFKAKGEAHKNIATAKPAQLDPSVAANVDAFIDLVLTDARLEQAANATALTQKIFEMPLLGKFVSWIEKDVQKETKAEIEASKLEWKLIQKPLINKARIWYISKAKS